MIKVLTANWCFRCVIMTCGKTHRRLPIASCWFAKAEFLVRYGPVHPHLAVRGIHVASCLFGFCFCDVMTSVLVSVFFPFFFC